MKVRSWVVLLWYFLQLAVFYPLKPIIMQKSTYEQSIMYRVDQEPRPTTDLRA